MDINRRLLYKALPTLESRHEEVCIQLAGNVESYLDLAKIQAQAVEKNTRDKLLNSTYSSALSRQIYSYQSLLSQRGMQRAKDALQLRARRQAS